MDEKQINTLISNAREYYKKKKYNKALSTIENISESDKLILDADEQTAFTLLQSLIYLKLDRYYESFNYILPLFVKFPHQADLIAKSKEIFSQEGIHRVIHVNLPRIRTEKQKMFLGFIQNVKDASEKGRCLTIFFLSVTKNYSYFDYLVKELSKQFPTNNFLSEQIKKDEKFQEETARIKREKEEIESAKEKNLTEELENIDEYIKAENYEELKNRLANIIREAKRYNLNYVTMKAQDLYNEYKQFFPPEEKIEKKMEKGPSFTKKPNALASLEARMRRSPAIREFVEDFLKFDIHQKFDEDTKKEYYDQEELGSLLVDAGGSEKILQAFEKDLKLNPGLKDVWVSKGVVLKQAGRLEEAILAYDNALKLDPGYKEVWYNKGIALVELGLPEEAIQVFDKALKLDPHYKQVWYIKGTTLQELDRLEEALQAYDKALELDPRFKEVWVNKGVALKWVGRLEEALQAYDKALELDPHIKAAWNNKGSVFEQLGRFEEALQAYDKALELDPNYKSAYYGKKAVLQKQPQQQDKKDEKTTKNKKYTLKQQDKKLEGEKSGIKVSIDLTSIMDNQYQKGIEYFDNNQIDLAIIEFKKSLKREKDLAYMKYEQLGHCYSKKGEYLEAVKFYGLTFKACPPAVQTDNILFNKALALKKLGRYDEAIMDLNEALRQESGLSNVWILKSNCHSAKGESEEKIKCLDKALEIEPKNLLAWKIKSSSLAMIGDEEKAQEILSKILTIEPIDAQSWCIKGERLVELGNFGEAMNCFNKALSLSQGLHNEYQFIEKCKQNQIRYQEILKNLPQSALEWNNRGVNLFRLGVNVEALGCFQKAMELRPNNSEFLENRALTYYHLERFEKAIADINELIKSKPNDANVWNQLGNIWFKKENFAKALDCFEKSLEINPNSAIVQENKEAALKRI